MLANASPVDEVLLGEFLAVEGFEVKIVSLKGHSPNQVGFLVDGVFFCADVVLPESVLEKYRIPYLFSVGDHLSSLESCAVAACHVVMPGHGQVLDSIVPLRDLNRALTLDVAEKVIEFTEHAVTPDQLLTRLLRHFGAAVSDAPSYYLLHPTVHAFLSYLHGQGRIKHQITDGQSLWEASR